MIHLVAYVAVCGFLCLVWVLTGGGTADDLDRYLSQPAEAPQPGFWPVWVILGWGVAIAIHAATTVVGTVSPRRRRVRRAERAEWRAAARAARRRPPGDLDTEVGRPARERRWVVVMFTDIAGSTELNEALGDDAWTARLGGHREAVRACMARHQGTEVGTQGDGFLVRFDSPDGAVACAVAIQRDATTGVDTTPRVRIGIHAGEAVHDDGDLLGKVVNLASRVTDTAEGGEILVTEPVADHLTGPVELDDRGLVDLRGVPRSRHLLAVRWSSTRHRDRPTRR